MKAYLKSIKIFGAPFVAGAAGFTYVTGGEWVFVISSALIFTVLRLTRQVDLI